MSGIAKFNIPAFDAAAAELRRRGFEVVSPAEIDGPVTRDVLLESPDGDHSDLPQDESWSYYLARDFRIIADDGIEAIVNLPGWENSKGATLENALAKAMGLACVTIEELISMQDWTRQNMEDLDFQKATDIVSESPPLDDTDHYDVDGKFIHYADNPERQRAVSGAVKDNRSKPRVDLVPSPALVEIGKVMAKGAEKYKPHNWRLGLGWSDTIGSALRHIYAFNNGEDLDPETGLSHIAHASCQLMFLLTYVVEGTGTDDRFSSMNKEEAKA